MSVTEIKKTAGQVGRESHTMSFVSDKGEMPIGYLGGDVK